MTLEAALFYLFSGIALISAILVISSRNPIHSVLFLILVFCNATCLLLLLQVEFLALLFLMVYVGAIAVLFLFVVMMLNIRLAELDESILRYLPVGGFIGIIFLCEVFLLVELDLTPLYQTDVLTPFLSYEGIHSWSASLTNVNNMVSIGHVLYTYYFYFFLVASLVLLVAMIGAIVLTIHKRTAIKKQDVFEQVAVNFEKNYCTY
jgi:NADH:ubiquinone oxidoreductase subunit 6 (subunit J)